MKRRVKQRGLRRIIAYLLAFALVFSGFTGTEFTSMASEANAAMTGDETGENSDAVIDSDKYYEDSSTTETDGDFEESEAEESGEPVSESEEETGEAATEDTTAEIETKDDTAESGMDDTPAGSEIDVEETTSENSVMQLAAVAQEESYTGTIEGVSSYMLTISQSEMVAAGQSFDKSGIADLMQANYEDKKFVEIRVLMDGEDKNYISTGIFDELFSYLDMENEPIMSWRFCGEDYDLDWIFVLPNEQFATDENIAVDGILTFENDDISVNISGMNTFVGHSGRIDLDFIVKESGDLDEALMGMNLAERVQLDLYEGTGAEPVSDLNAVWDCESKHVFSIPFAENVKDGATYHLKSHAYKGTVEDRSGEGHGLVIDQDQMLRNCMDLNPEDVNKILSNYEEGSFDFIDLEVKFDDRTVDADVYNILVPYLNQANDERKITYRFCNGLNTDGSYIINWRFLRPNDSAVGTISTDATMTLETNGQISVCMPQLSELSAWAQESDMHFWVEAGTDWCNDLIGIFGDDPVESSLFRGEEQLDHYIRWDRDEAGNHWLYIGDVAALEGDVIYTVGNAATDIGYLGIVRNVSQGKKLTISQTSMETDGQVFNADGLKKLLAHYEEKFYGITVLIKSDGSDVIEEEIYNALLPYLDSELEGRTLCLDFVHDDFSDYGWDFVNPVALVGDKDVSVSFLMAEDGLTVRFSAAAALADCAENIQFNYWFGSMGSDNSIYCALEELGNCDISLYEGDSEKPIEENEAYVFGNSDMGYGLHIVRMGLLKENTPYRIEKELYRGYVSQNADGSQNLTISQFELEADGLVFDLETVEDILTDYKGQLFDTITFMVSGDEIQSAIFNAALEYVDYSREGANVRFFFLDMGGTLSFFYQFLNPGNMEQDIAAGFDWSQREDDGSLILTFREAEALRNCAEEVLWSLSVYSRVDNSAKPLYESMAALSDKYELFGLWDEEAASWQDDVSVSLISNESYGLQNLQIQNFQNLKKDTCYRLNGQTYLGEVYDHDGEHSLYIDYKEMKRYGMFFYSAVDTILQNYQEGSFDVIGIYADGTDGAFLWADIYNALVPYLKPDYEYARIDYSFDIGIDGCKLVWTFGHPVASMDNNPNGYAWVSAEDGVVTIKLASTDVFESCAENVSMNFELENGSELCVSLIDVLGEEGRNLVLYAPDSQDAVENVEAEWSRDDNFSRLHIYNLQNLAADTSYTVGDYFYRGNTWYDDDGTSNLWISSFGLSKDKFGKGELEAIIDSYVKAGKTFDRIYIEEKYAEKGKTIQKDYVNLARKILDAEYETSTDAMDTWNRLSFVFSDNSEEKEDKLYWHFWNPSAAKNNISADVTLTAVENGGLTCKLSSNQSVLKAAAQSTEIEFNVSQALNKAQLIRTGLGAIKAGEGSDLIVLKSGTTYESNVHPWYENWGETLNLRISCVQWCIANTAYVLLRPNEVETVYNASDVLMLGTGDFALSYAPSGTVTWKSSDTGVASVNYNSATKNNELWIVDGGETIVWASYKSGKLSYTEAYHLHTVNDILGIAFDRSELTMELNYKDVWDVEQGYEDQREGLNIRITPAEHGCDTNQYLDSDDSEISWTIETNSSVGDSKVVEFVEQEENDRKFYNGEIRAVGPGTATVTATLLNGKENTDEAVTASCEVTVLPAISMEDVEWPDVYACIYRDTKLSDVENQLPENWKWTEPGTDLTKFYNTDGHEFSAEYTYTDQKTGLMRTQTYSVWVRIARINAVSILQAIDSGDSAEGWVSDVIPDTLKVDEALTLWWEIEPVGFSTEEEFAEYLLDENLVVTWTAKNGTISSMDDTDTENIRKRIYVPVKKNGKQFTGKETLTVTLSYRDPVNPKKLTKLATDTVSFTVVEKDPFDFENDIFMEWDEDSYVDAKGNQKTALYLSLYVDKDKYSGFKKALGVVSSDTSVLAFGKQTVYKEAEEIKKISGAEQAIESKNKDINSIVLVRVPYTEKGTGTVGITVTAYEETNVTRTYTKKIPNPKPQLGIATVTINMASEDAAAETVIYGDSEYPIVNVALREDESRFRIDTLNAGTQADVRISLTDGSAVKKGTTYKVPLIVSVASEEEIRTETLNLNVKITNSIPALTVKQTKKVNLFYDDEESYGLLTATAKDAEIEELWLDHENYELVNNGDGSWLIRLKEGVGDGMSSADANNNKKLSKSGKLYCKLAGYQGEYQIVKSFTVSTAVTKPTVVLSSKTDTLYTMLNYKTSSLELSDKATGEALQLSSVQLVKKAGKVTEYTELISEKAVEVTPQYSTYAVTGEPDSGRLSFEVMKTASATKKDTFSLQVKEDNWRDYISVSYSITADVKTASPKVKLGSTTITLNAADDVYQYQQVKTPITLTNSVGLMDENTDVWFTGNDTKSTKALKMDGNLLLQYWGGDQSNVVARVNGSGLAAGTYKYTVWVANNSCNYKTSATLTVKVVSKKAQQCLTVSGKGSIDVLDREGTSVVYTPKISNLSGTIIGGYLEGRDACLFDCEFNETDGKLYVRAREGCSYITGYAYQVVPVFWVQPEDYPGFSVRNSKALSITVKQGKPKLTLSSVTNTLYRGSDNSLQINIGALLGTKKVEVEYVELLNYTEDLYLEAYDSWVDDDGKEYGIVYDPDSGYILLKATEPHEILKTGKSWNLKFGVHYRDQAGNQKDTQVTYKVIVK